MNDGHFFAMYVPVRLIGEKDSLDLRLQNTYSGELYSKNINFRIKQIIFDPDKHLISKNANIDVLLKEDCIVYPNPILDVLNIKAKEKITEVFVFREDGRQLLQIFPQKEKYKITTSSWSKGVYLIQIKTLNFSKTYKLIK